jgi:hypothetical protein
MQLGLLASNSEYYQVVRSGMSPSQLNALYTTSVKVAKHILY